MHKNSRMSPSSGKLRQRHNESTRCSKANTSESVDNAVEYSKGAKKASNSDLNASLAKEAEMFDALSMLLDDQQQTTVDAAKIRRDMEADLLDAVVKAVNKIDQSSQAELQRAVHAAHVQKIITITELIKRFLYRVEAMKTVKQRHDSDLNKQIETFGDVQSSMTDKIKTFRKAFAKLGVTAP